MYGGKDLITAPSSSIYLHQNIYSQDKEIEICDGLFQETFNEPGTEICNHVINWLNKH